VGAHRLHRAGLDIPAALSDPFGIQEQVSGRIV
jgi:hypothetical protein